MVDSNVFDVLVDDAAARQAVLAAIEDKRLVLRTTHVQEDELAATPDKDRRTQLQQVVPRDRVVTSVGVFGVSKWGAASFGGSEEHEAIRHGPNHIEDAIIAATAVTDAHVLVTEEKRLRNRAQARLTVPVWNVARLVEWATSGHPSDDSPLREAGRVLDEAEYLDLQSQVDAHGEALRLMHEALRALTREEHSRRGSSPPGVRY
jgi:predicted nucleic acid-binding protein